MIWLTFKEVLEEVAYAIGLDPQANLQENQAAALCRYIDKWVRKTWRASDWPELCPIEMRAFRPEWNVATTYAAGAEVYSPDACGYYVALVPNTGIAITNTETWKVQTTLNRYVAFEQPGKAVIGTPLSAWRKNPETDPNPQGIAFWRTQNGVQFRPDAPNEIWLKFRLPAPRLRTVRMDRVPMGKAGEVYYDVDDGQCYLIKTTPSTWPPAASEMEVQQIPDFLRDAIVSGVRTEVLREEGQYDKVSIQASEAEELLSDEEFQINTQQRQTRRYSVRVS